MGSWDTAPWDNDAAADYFGDLFDECRLRELVVKKLSEQVDGENHEQIRAAATVLLFFARVYVWPIDSFDEDIKLAIEKLTQVAEQEVIKEVPGYVAAIKNEISILEARLDKSLTLDEFARLYWGSLV